MAELGRLSREGIVCSDEWSEVRLAIPMPEVDEYVDRSDILRFRSSHVMPLSRWSWKKRFSPQE